MDGYSNATKLDYGVDSARQHRWMQCINRVNGAADVIRKSPKLKHAPQRTFRQDILDAPSSCSYYPIAPSRHAQTRCPRHATARPSRKIRVPEAKKKKTSKLCTAAPLSRIPPKPPRPASPSCCELATPRGRDPSKNAAALVILFRPNRRRTQPPIPPIILLCLRRVHDNDIHDLRDLCRWIDCYCFLG